MAERSEYQHGDRTEYGDESRNDTSAIRAEIAETRERMSETLDEIGSRLNPQVVKEQVTQRVKEGIREATIGRVEHMAKQAVDKVNDTRYTLTDTIRENPVPAALVAIGLGWMMINSRSSSSRSHEWSSSMSDTSSPEYGLADYDSMSPEERSRLGRARERVSEVAGTARERVHHATDAAREKMHHATDSARERAHDIADRARGAAGNVRDRATHLASSARDTTRRTALRVEDMYQENPIALGAVTMALGVAAGFAVPRTDREVRFFGDAREEVVDRVRDVADEAKEKVQHVASRVVSEAKTAAREEGLPGV